LHDHPQMVVFNAERPVRCEAILKADTHGELAGTGWPGVW